MSGASARCHDAAARHRCCLTSMLPLALAAPNDTCADPGSSYVRCLQRLGFRQASGRRRQLRCGCSRACVWPGQRLELVRPRLMRARGLHVQDAGWAPAACLTPAPHTCAELASCTGPGPGHSSTFAPPPPPPHTHTPLRPSLFSEPGRLCSAASHGTTWNSST